MTGQSVANQPVSREDSSVERRSGGAPAVQSDQRVPSVPGEVSFEGVAKSVTNDPSTHVHKGMGYRYERHGNANDKQVALEQVKVKALQGALNAMGADLAVDGLFGPKTEETLKAVQKKLGLPETGALDAQTAQKILAVGQGQAAQAQGQGESGAAAQPGASGGRKEEVLRSFVQAAQGTPLDKPVQQYAAALASGDASTEAQAYSQIRSALANTGASGGQLAGKLDKIRQEKGPGGVVSALTSLLSRGKSGNAPREGAQSGEAGRAPAGSGYPEPEQQTDASDG